MALCEVRLILPAKRSIPRLHFNNRIDRQNCLKGRKERKMKRFRMVLAVVIAVLVGLSLFFTTGILAQQPSKTIVTKMACDPPGSSCPSFPEGCADACSTDEAPGTVCTEDKLCIWNREAYCIVGQCGAECWTDDNCPIGEVCTGLCDCKCVKPVGGIAELPEIAGSEAAMSETAATNHALWVGIAALSAFAAIAFVGVAWYTRRRWLS